jgi:hypothetical protein
MFFHSPEPLADVRVNPSIHKRNLPIMDIAVEEMKIPAALGQGKIV